eukprot:3212314-Karenia_brevis.AAC.1
MRRRGVRLEKIKSRCEYGIFVGVNRRSNEFLISTERGVLKVRSIERIPKGETWGEDNLRWVKWAPWKRHEEDEEADGEVPEGVGDEERKKKDHESVSGGDKDRVVYIETRSRVPRSFKITEDDVDKYKPTPGCSGCSALRRGMA